jgi:hypothetical protein
VNKTDTAHAAQNDTFNFNPLFGSDELKLQTTPENWGSGFIISSLNEGQRNDDSAVNQ